MFGGVSPKTKITIEVILEWFTKYLSPWAISHLFIEVRWITSGPVLIKFDNTGAVIRARLNVGETLEEVRFG